MGLLLFSGSYGGSNDVVREGKIYVAAKQIGSGPWVLENVTVELQNGKEIKA